jgi:hypothetical protein
MDAGPKQLIGRIYSHPDATGHILSVSDDQVHPVLPADIGQETAYRPAPRPANDITDNQYHH